MKWPLMTNEELHKFGIEMILPYLDKEGVTVESINPDMKSNPQIVGRRWGKLAFIVVRTACYPSKGELKQDEHIHIVNWSDKHSASAFFASVGVACMKYPDKSSVTADSDMQLPIRNAGFAVSYSGLVIMTMSNRVQVWSPSE